MKILFTFLFLIPIMLEGQSVSVDKILEIANNVKNENSLFYHFDDLTHDFYQKSNYDFIRNNTIKGSKKNEIYFNDGNPVRIFRISGGLEYEFSIKRLDSLSIMFVKSHPKNKRDVGDFINGFFLIDHSNLEIYFFKLSQELFEEQAFTIPNLQSIMRLDHELNPLSKIVFINGVVKYSTDILSLGKKSKERIYLYHLIDDEECNKYKSLRNLDLKRLKHFFYQKYHCPVAIEITSEFVLNFKKRPLWAQGGYYK